MLSPFQGDNTYIIDIESGAELARQIEYDRLIIKGMGGLLPGLNDLPGIHAVLDIACGPGGWVLDWARANPQIEVVGIDVDKQVIDYARARAQVQGLDNAGFLVMDALKPLDFPDQYFDLVNGRFLFTSIPNAGWRKLIEECFRITRPGGFICLTETEGDISNSPATESLSQMFVRALSTAGRSFSPVGQHIGITPMLSYFLRSAGYRNTREIAHCINFSAGTEAHEGFNQDLKVYYKLIMPFIIKMGITTVEIFESLYEQVLAEMLADDFCAVRYFLTAYGEKLS